MAEDGALPLRPSLVASEGCAVGAPAGSGAAGVGGAGAGAGAPQLPPAATPLGRLLPSQSVKRQRSLGGESTGSEEPSGTPYLSRNASEPCGEIWQGPLLSLAGKLRPLLAPMQSARILLALKLVVCILRTACGSVSVFLRVWGGISWAGGQCTVAVQVVCIWATLSHTALPTGLRVLPRQC